MTEYQTIAGTPADPEVQHEPRTIQRIETTEFYIMSEIGDGVFVQWSTCARCSKQVASCICGAGPQEADHIIRWRTQRFEKSFAERGIESRATPRAVKGLLEDAQAAQDAAYGDSNDDEIELLRGALESAFDLLGLKLPDGVDPDDDERDDGDNFPEVDVTEAAIPLGSPTALEQTLGIKPEPNDVERSLDALERGEATVKSVRDGTALEATLGIKPESIGETVDDALAAGLERMREVKGNDVGF